MDMTAYRTSATVDKNESSSVSSSTDANTICTYTSPNRKKTIQESLSTNGKCKIWQLPKQSDPELEKQRLRAVKARRHRETTAKREEELRQKMNDAYQEVKILQVENGKLQEENGKLQEIIAKLKTRIQELEAEKQNKEEK